VSANRSQPRICIGLTLAAALLAIAMATPAGAADPQPDAVLSGGGLTVLHLSERADRQLKADRLQATLRVDASGADATVVQGQINQAMAAALVKAKAATGVTVETGGYTVYEDRSPTAPAQWRGSQSMTIGGGDTAAVLTLAGILQNDGLAISGMAFDLAPETARTVEDDMTDVALGRLRKRADRIAATLDLGVVRIRDIHVGNANDAQPRPMPMLARMAASSPIVAPSAEASMVTVQVTVDAEFLLGARPAR